MSKLPTAKDVLDKHAIDRGSITIGNFTCASVSYEKALKAIESHTAAHTAALRERVKELEDLFSYLVGLEAWIEDRAMREVFTNVLRKALKK